MEIINNTTSIKYLHADVEIDLSAPIWAMMTAAFIRVLFIYLLSTHVLGQTVWGGEYLALNRLVYLVYDTP